MTVSAADCRSCGACCAPERCNVPDCGCQPFTHAWVSQEDIRRLPVVYHRHVLHDRDGSGHLTTKETRVGRVCVALRGTIGAAVTCLVYESRPKVCREFAPGSPLCLAARAEAQLSTAGARS